MANASNSVNVSRHLGVVGRVNLGSFYTPARYVERVGQWLLAHGVGKEWTIADVSCGYGAFFELKDIPGLENCRYVGNDIDPAAVAKAREVFPYVHFSERNALLGVSRENFGLKGTERLVIVGNPPYNDVTSQINQKIKSKSPLIDADIKTRDIGMSSLLAYDKLEAEYVAVLHPLSYLIKKANFKATRRFFGNYQLIEHVVFSSQEFAGTSKTSGFPVIVALYRRAVGQGLTYEDVCRFWFKTVEGAEFSLAGFDYVTDEIDKYPNDNRYEPEILFYTLRDMNALRRSRTFMAKRKVNSVDVNPQKLAYYCYVDCFKRYAEVPYYLGNFNVPFVRAEFAGVSNDVLAVSRYQHRDIFKDAAKPSAEAENRIRRYIAKALKGKDKTECRQKTQRSSTVQPTFL